MPKDIQRNDTNADFADGGYFEAEFFTVRKVAQVIWEQYHRVYHGEQESLERYLRKQLEDCQPYKKGHKGPGAASLYFWNDFENVIKNYQVNDITFDAQLIYERLVWNDHKKE